MKMAIQWRSQQWRISIGSWRNRRNQWWPGHPLGGWLICLCSYCRPGVSWLPRGLSQTLASCSNLGGVQWLLKQIWRSGIGIVWLAGWPRNQISFWPMQCFSWPSGVS